MLEGIHLKNIFTLEDRENLWELMEKEKGIKEIFHDKQDRVNSSVVSCLIKKEEETVGFFLLAKEVIDGIYFLDMGIKKEYRNKKIAQAICEEIIKQSLPEFIIAETKVTNIGANKSLAPYSSLIHNVEDINYYLLDKNRKQEFLGSPIYDNFINYCHSEKPRQYQYMKNLMNGKI